MEMTTEVPTNITNTTDDTTNECPGLGERWWAFLAITSVIYVIFLSVFFLVYAVYWLLMVKFKLQLFADLKTSRVHSYCKTIRDHIRQIKSGDTIPGKILITVTLVCNLVYLGLTIHRSFPPHKVEECIDIGNPEVIIELILTVELLIYALVRLLACDHIFLFWLQPHTVVDVLTLPHIFISLFYGVDWIGLRSLRFFYLTQITLVLQFTPLLRSQTAIDILNLLVYFLVLWFTSSGILHLIESQGDFWVNMDEVDVNEDSINTFLTYVYLTMVTMSTVGYGDVSPLTASGRTFMILFILGGLAFFAAILPKLVEVTTDLYAKYQYAAFDTTRVPKHVIVCGHVTAVTAEEFLKDFLHPDRGDTRTHVLFLHPEWPDKDLKNVLRTYYTRVQYLLGSVLNGNDLEKAKIHLSSGIFILANKHAENPTEEDHANLLRVVSVKNTTDRIPIIIQLLHSFSKIQVSNIEGWHAGRDIAVCLNELKLGLLAQSCLCPGFSTLVANLFYTSDFPLFSNFTGEDEWKEHYFKGASNEVYSTTFSEAFENMTFHEAAGVCYNKLNLVLLALEHIEPYCHYYYVNPSQKLHPNVRIKTDAMMGYFIAQDKEHVTDVSVYCECCNGHQHLTSNTLLRRKLSSRRRQSRSVVMMRSKKPLQSSNDMTLSLSPPAKDDGIQNEDLIVHFYSSAENSPESTPGMRSSTLLEQNGSGLMIANEAVQVSIELEKRRNKIPIIEVTADTPDEEEKGVDDQEKWKLHLSKPVELEHTILNPHILSLSERKAHMGMEAELKDHIILCLFANSKSPLIGLHNFLKPLRSKHLPLESIKPVVIICEKKYIEKEWPVICDIPKVYLVVGSPLLWSNLSAAGATKCSVCVVLTLLHTSSGHEQAIDDKEAILCSLSIQKKLKKVNKKALIITDLRQESNVQFLDFGDEDKPDERIYKAQPFACGEAFSASMFDSVTSSVYHGPGTLYLVEDLIHSAGTKTLCQVVSVPVCYSGHVGSTFGDYFNAQLKESKICLGISRKLRPGGNQSYVITAPNSKLILQETDVAFILTE